MFPESALEFVPSFPAWVEGMLAVPVVELLAALARMLVEVVLAASVCQLVEMVVLGLVGSERQLVEVEPPELAGMEMGAVAALAVMALPDTLNFLRMPTHFRNQTRVEAVVFDNPDSHLEASYFDKANFVAEVGEVASDNPNFLQNRAVEVGAVVYQFDKNLCWCLRCNVVVLAHSVPIRQLVHCFG